MQGRSERKSALGKGDALVGLLALLGAVALFLTGCDAPAPPAASFVSSPMSGQAPLHVMFDASSSQRMGSELVTFQWAFGDGAAAGGPQVEHTYASEGVYQVVLFVEDARGLRAWQVASILVSPAAQSVIEGAKVGDIVRFYDGSLLAYLVGEILMVDGDQALIAPFVGPRDADLKHMLLGMSVLTIATEEQRSRILAVPADYYNFEDEYNAATTFAQLESFLAAFELPPEVEPLLRGVPRDAARNLSDTIRAASYMEYKLEEAGFDARIVTGPSPWPRTEGDSAWIIVWTVDGCIALDPSLCNQFAQDVGPVIFSSDSALSPYYSGQDVSAYYDVYGALWERDLDDLAWWTSVEW